MTISPAEKALEDQLAEAGNRLLSPPSSVDELLPLLDKVEFCLARVEQSPSKSMQNALTPSMQALVTKELLRHTDFDVKVSVAACISEITRITAPDAPYDDDQMKEIFQLIVSSFEKLYDKSSRSYNKRASILETVAKVRSCVVMLDLECDALILEMFKYFLQSIRDDHPEHIFSCMETIMTLVLEESEDIPTELLSPILECLKKDNKEVLPIAQKLSERVLGKCSSKLKHYLVQAVKLMGVSVFDYNKVVADICGEMFEAGQASQGNAADENSVEGSKMPKANSEGVSKEASAGDTPAVCEVAPAPASVGSPKTVTSNGTLRKENDEPMAAEDSSKEPETDECTESKAAEASSKAETEHVEPGSVDKPQSKMGKANKRKGKKVGSAKSSSEPSSCAPMDVEKETEKILEHQVAESKDGENRRCDDNTAEAPVEKEEQKEAVEDVLLPKNSVHEVVDGEIGSKNVGEEKEDNLIGEATTSVDTDSKKLPEANALSGVKSNKRTSKKDLLSTGNEESTPSTIMDMQKTPEATTASGSKSHKCAVRKAGSSAHNEESIPSVDPDSRKETGATIVESKASKRTARKAFLVAQKEESAGGAEDISKKDDVATSDNDTRSKQSAKKVEPGSKKKKGQEKATVGKNRAKTLLKDASKEYVSSLKSASKTSKQNADEKTPKENSSEKIVKENASEKNLKESAPEKILKTDSKRKRPPEEENASESKDGEGLVGSRIKVYWPEDDQFYEGIIDSFDHLEKMHKVSYDDGDVEVLNLDNERWEFLKGDPALERGDASDDESRDTSSEMHVKKKAKTGPASSKKQGKANASSKKGRLSSSIKPKTARSKSGSLRAKNDASKSAGGKDEKGGKYKDIAAKIGFKLSDEDNMKTPKAGNKPKQETPKNVTKSKGKASKNEAKSETNGAGNKMKSGSSSTGAKDAKKTQESVKASESEKVKSPGPSKPLKSGSKTSKKRSRRG